MSLQKQRRDGVEHGSTARFAPVGKGKQAPKSLQHIRLFEDDIELAMALAKSRRDTTYPHIARRAFRRGIRAEAALGAADEQTGYFGTLHGERLAAEQEADIDALINFQIRHRHTPTLIRLLLELLRERGVTPAQAELIRPLLTNELDSLRENTSATADVPVAPEAEHTLRSVDLGAV